jgi:magnesium transporter
MDDRMLQAYGIAGGKLAPVSAAAGALGAAFWIDMHEPTPEEQLALEQALGIKCRLPEEPARFQVSQPLRHSDGSVVLTALLLGGFREKRPQLITVSFVLGGGPLITVTKGGAGGLGWLARESEELDLGKPPDAFSTLLGIIVEHITDALDHIGDRLDRLNRTLFQRRAGRLLRAGMQASPRRRNRQLERILTDLGYCGEVLVKLRRSVLSLQRVISLLREHNTEAVPARQLKGFERQLQTLAQAEEDLATSTAFMLEGTVGYIGILQSRSINIMTILGLLLTPPVLVASVYGMNFTHMPELSWSWGYAWALGLMTFSALATYVVVRVRGWL